MKRAAVILLLAGLSAAHAQDARQPFDMSPERPPAEQGAPPAANPPPPAEPQARAMAGRHLLPDASLTLTGEIDARSWAFHLTASQAAAPARLHLGYRNAVVAAPESSRLQVLLNGVAVMDEAMTSSEGFATLEADVPPGALLPGRNEISVRSRQRHRTDCTIESTYELWAEVDAARTFLTFGGAADGYAGFSDLKALAPDASGRTRVDIVAPALASVDMTADILRLAQAIALYSNQTNLEFSVGAAPDMQRRDAAVRVLLGSADELRPLAALPPGATSGPVATFLEGAELPTLLVTGRGREDWSAAIEQILAPVDRRAGTRRDALVTESWRVPNAPMAYDRRSLTLAELGISSEEFSGRRFLRSFAFAIPSDFYAGAYGEAELLLDAAYSAEVLPGSSVNVYVNGSIAASMQLTERSGAVLDQLPIKVTMRHFRPGLNEVAIEADLPSESDSACLPGTSENQTPRFALFDTSRFVVPDFGRIGQYPNLAAMAGTGYPYGLANDPVAVVLDRGDVASLSVAANVLARVAIGAGRSVPISSTTSTDAARDQDAIFVGPVNAIPAGVLDQVGVSEEARTGWTTTIVPDVAATSDTTSLADWRKQTQGIGLRDVSDWFSETFGITLDMMRFAPADAAAFVPSRNEGLLVAQGINPTGNGVWTVVAAPSQQTLLAGAATLAGHGMWQQLSGRLTTLGGDMKTVQTKPVATFALVETQPPSFANYRLIAANWLSANILSYSLLLVVACLLLGMATSGLLSRLGRRR